MDPTRCAAAIPAPSEVGTVCSTSIDMGEWAAGRGVDACCLSRSTDESAGDPASRNLTPNEVADTKMGAALLVLSSDSLVEANGAMLDTDGMGSTRPSTCGTSEHTRLASDVTDSKGTACELSTIFEDLTSRVGGEGGVYVVQEDAMYTPCTQDWIGYALGNLRVEPWEARRHPIYDLPYSS